MGFKSAFKEFIKILEWELAARRSFVILLGHFAQTSGCHFEIGHVGFVRIRSVFLVLDLSLTCMMLQRVLFNYRLHKCYSYFYQIKLQGNIYRPEHCITFIHSFHWHVQNATIHSFHWHVQNATIHSFIPLACAECDNSFIHSIGMCRMRRFIHSFH